MGVSHEPRILIYGSAKHVENDALLLSVHQAMLNRHSTDLSRCLLSWERAL